MPDRVGYTSDGLVFFITEANFGTEDTIVPTTFTWEPETAIEFAKKIAQAAKEALSVKQEIISNGRDSD